MRIDGLSTSAYPLERPARPGSAVTPYRESQRAVEEQRQQPAADSTAASQGFEREPYIRQPDPSQPGAELQNEYFPARFVQEPVERPLTSRAAQALASYSTTASLARDIDANEVLGLDLYA
ncbi:hypothetical protein [Stutzerimonas azotifigens]|uniref:hypothetical protein n=1 Tax=Stutzerimonas azotifigens TaxID=291995 RepID=UPI00041E3134|nr:hypothetical protein [Stutzerimonas azotifigens]